MRIKDWSIAQNIANSGVNHDPPMPTQKNLEIDATRGEGEASVDIPQNLIRFPNFTIPDSVLVRISCPHCGRESYRYLQLYPRGTTVAVIPCECGNSTTTHTELKIDVKIAVTVAPSATL